MSSSYIKSYTAPYIFPAASWLGGSDLLLDGASPVMAAQYGNNRYSIAGEGLTFDQMHTFSRPSVGTYVDASGRTQGAAANVPRFGYVGGSRGLLLEPSATNLQRYSTDFSNAIWLKGATITPNQGGGFYPSADLAIPSPAGGTFVELFQNSTVSAGTVYTQQYKIKSAGLRYVQIIGPGGIFGGFNVNFDLVNGVVSDINPSNTLQLKATIDHLADGFFLIRVSAESFIDAGYGRLAINFIKSATTGRGVNEGGFNLSDGYLVADAQCEAGSIGTSYIETTASPVTRAADTCAIDDKFSEFWTQPQGTLYTRSNMTGLSASGDILRADDGTGNNLIRLQQDTGNNAFMNIRNGASNTVSTSLSSSIERVWSRQAVAYELNNSAGVSDGDLTATDTICTIPGGLTQLLVMGGSTGIVSEIRYYNIRGSSVGLADITLDIPVLLSQDGFTLLSGDGLILTT